VLLDLHLPDASGLDLLAKSRNRYPDVPAIMVTTSNSVTDVVGALKGGAIDYVTKPVEHQRLVASVGNALKMLRQPQDLAKLRSELNETYRLEHIIGDTSAMATVRELNPPGGAERRHGADLRREWHRQGARRPGAALLESARG
jgi:DNA-binding NtrC family response regulator